jgi:hypothetical protein
MRKRIGLRAAFCAGAVLLLLPLIPILSLQAGPRSGPPHPGLGPDSYQIFMISRQFTPSRGLARPDRLVLENQAQHALAVGRTRVHALVQLDYIPTVEERTALAQQGLTLLEYIPNYAWLAAIPADNLSQVASLPGIRWVGSVAAADKQDPALSLESSPWAYDAASGQVALYVMLHRDVSAQEGAALLTRFGQVKSYAASANLYVVWLDKDQVGALLKEDLVSWVQPAEPRWEAMNYETRLWIGSATLDGSGYNYADGTNVDILIYDVGSVLATHYDLTPRVTVHDAACPTSGTYANHATHVACTTGSNGWNNAAPGMADDMHALLSDCMSSKTGAYYYTDPGELQSDLTYAKNTWAPSGGDGDGAELWNASVGTNVASNNWPCTWEGNYGPTDIIVDNMVRGDIASGKFIAVWANGDERQGYARCGATYYTTPPPACGKNAIQVGATYKNSDTMTDFSSWGPCDDGRLKPVVSAPGCATGGGGIYSCTAAGNMSYANMCGTSMASAVTAGVVAQLIEYCRGQGLSYCTSSGEFWPSSARALLMHAAVDLGNPGPDYQFGYGRIQADATADLLTNSAPNYADLHQSTIGNQGEVESYTVNVSGSPAQLKVSLAWDDDAATIHALKKLVNDLDLEVVSPSGTTYRPYILDPSDPGSAATTGVDSVNNQEQVVVSSPANGTWTIRVIGKAVPAAPQDYSIVFPNAYNIAPSETPGTPPTVTPTPDPSYCAEYITNGGIESGTSGWTIAGSAAQSGAYYHAGSYSMAAGGTWDGTFYQDIAVPSDMYDGTISFWYRMQTSESTHPHDFFDVELRDPASNQVLTTLLSTDDSKTNGAWTQVSLAIGSEYAGRNVRLHFTADVDGATNTYWYVDEVSVNLCRVVPGPTSTNTPGPSPTPVATPTPPPAESGGEQAPLCEDDPAGLLGMPGPLIAAPGLPLAGRPAAGAGSIQAATVVLAQAPDEATTTLVQGSRAEPASTAPAPPLAPPLTEARPEAVNPIPNIQVEGMTNDSGWVTAASDNQGNLYTAFEYEYATGCGGTCYAVVAGKSRDNGRSWDLRYVSAGTASSARRPSIAVDADGKLYIAMEFYYDPGTGARWYPAVAQSACPRDVSSWSVTYWNTPYALVPGATSADAGGDGNDVYLEFQVPCESDGYADVYSLFTTTGGASWNENYLDMAQTNHYLYPTVSVGNATAVITVLCNSGAPSRDFYHFAVGSAPAGLRFTWIDGLSYAEADASGPYHYVVYHRTPLGGDENVYVRYSTNDGSSFASEVTIDATGGSNQRYPDVAANGARVRVAYISGGNRTLLRTSDNNGASWSAAYTLNTAGNTTVEGVHFVGLAYQPTGGPADGKHPIAMWVDNRDGNDNIYLGTINDPPTTAALSWPANGATITAFAPSLTWTAGGDPDGDPLHYWWYVDTTGGTTLVGGPVSLLSSLPYYAAPGTTYYWKVRADDGYQTVDTAVRSFTTASEAFSGSPGSQTYTEGFASDPAPRWTRKAFACLDCFEADPIRWTVTPAGKWIRSSTYAWSGTYSAQVLYDADNADYQMTSPRLDLRGTAWAFFNTRYRGSSESGADILDLESRLDSTASCWNVEASVSGDYSGSWQAYPEGNIDLTAAARTTSAQVRFRFVTDGQNHGGSYGLGWYEDEPEVARESSWAWNAGGFSRLQDSDGGWYGYTNNLVDQFYSPFIALPSYAGKSIRLLLTERYNVSSGDRATVWIRDAAASTWQQLATYHGLQGSWTDRTVPIPDSYKGRTVVIALVLRSDNSGTLGGPGDGGSIQESGGYWDVDRFLLEEYTPTAVKLTSFAAVPASGGILVTWETASEYDNLGFNLYRSEAVGALGVRLNDTLIPSQVPGQGQGASYAFLDTAVLPGGPYYYTLEDVDASGVRTPHGPVVFTLWRAYLPLVER